MKSGLETQLGLLRKLRMYKHHFKFIFLTTVHNRKDTTLRCLGFLGKFCHQNGLDCHFIVVDDGSTDGTREELQAKFPYVELIQGDGTLFWAGGMRKGFDQIKNKLYHYDYLIAYNDDIDLWEEPLKIFFTMLKSTEILVGAFASKNGGLSYGGRRQSGFWPLNFGPVRESDLGKLIDVANFNFVAIPHDLLSEIRLIDDYFIHNGADYDFSLRAKKLNYQLRMFSHVLGIAERNSLNNTSADSALSIIERMKKLISEKEYPIRQRFIFCKKHGGKSWFLWFIRPYLGFFSKLLWPS